MENHSALLRLREQLETKKGIENSYRIPKIWNTVGFLDCHETGDGEIVIDPAAFFIHAIDVILRRSEQKGTMQVSTDLRNHFIYAAMIRSLTAWDHHEKDCVESGTFVKAIALIPYIQSLGYDIIYLLPVFQSSDMHKKGTAGSPYSVRDFFSLDPIQHEPVLGECDTETLDLEFAAFVEAAQKMRMRVIVDFVFRTCARDNRWIRTHPDWFYWIKSDAAEQFTPIHVDALPPLSPPNFENMSKLYSDPSLSTYLSTFQNDPKTQNPEAFESLCASVSDDQLLSAIEKKFGVTTAPAYSDVINDSQPLWSDVTYLRFDMAKNALAQHVVPDGIPPFILNDGMKMSNFSPGQINEELCEQLTYFIPNCQKKYGIDGARLDMGHALPQDLLMRIIRSARDNDPNFILWSEVFDVASSFEAKKQGFDFISGQLWAGYPHRRSFDFNENYMLPLIDSALPSVAAISLPDSPRVAALIPDKEERRDALVFNSFLPNSIPFMTAGCEWGEKQPMNLGLGDHRGAAFLLPKGDPMRGKLAFFDVYRMHWTQADMLQLEALRQANMLRSQLPELYNDNKAFLPLESFQAPSSCTQFSLQQATDRIFVYWRRNLSSSCDMEWSSKLLYRSGLDEKMIPDAKSAGLVIIHEEKR